MCLFERGTEASGLIWFNDCVVEEIRRPGWIATVKSDDVPEKREREQVINMRLPIPIYLLECLRSSRDGGWRAPPC